MTASHSAAASRSSTAALSISLKSSSVFALSSVPGATQSDGGTDDAGGAKASAATQNGDDASRRAAREAAADGHRRVRELELLELLLRELGEEADVDRAGERLELEDVGHEGIAAVAEDGAVAVTCGLALWIFAHAQPGTPGKRSARERAQTDRSRELGVRDPC